MTKTTRQAYFFGANTARGFVNYADDIFGGIRKRYWIKGGPGTGKSTLMKRVAAVAEEKGYTVERYVCASDDKSLDGVVIPSLSIGIADATAPHLLETRYPGASEELWDLGAFWDRRLLEERYEAIKALVDSKSLAYASVYKYLGVGMTLRGERGRLLSSCIDKEKMEKAAERLIRRMGAGKGFRLLPRQITAIGMGGEVVLDTYEAMAEERWQIVDSRGLQGAMLDCLLHHAERAGLTVLVSRDPMLEADALYFPEVRIAVSSRGNAEKADRVINTERFVQRERLSDQRRRIRFLSRLEKELMTRVSELFCEIKTKHFALEGLYRDAMDFDAMEHETACWMQRLGL